MFYRLECGLFWWLSMWAGEKNCRCEEYSLCLNYIKFIAVQVMQIHTELMYQLLTGMLMSLTIIMNFSFQFYHFFPLVFWCAIVRWTHILYTYVHRIFMFWRIDPFIIMQCPSLSLINSLLLYVLYVKLMQLLQFSLDWC